MPTPMMSGLGSGVDTKDIIKKLVEVEKAPIARHERSRDDLGLENQALLELRKRSKKLQDALKVLNGFEAGFELKTVKTNPEGFVTGVANKLAKTGEYKLEVKKLASSLSISSDRLLPAKQLPAAQIGINGVIQSFSGGSLEDLNKFFNHHFKEAINARRVMVTEKENILIIESKEAGSDGIPVFSDPDNLLASIGLLSGQQLPQIDPEQKKNEPEKKPEENPTIADLLPPTPKYEQEEHIPIVVTQESLAVLNNEAAVVSPDGSTLILAKGAKREYKEAPPEIGGRFIKALNFQLSYPKEKLLPDDPGPVKLADGPKEKLNIRGVELQTYNIERNRELPDMVPVEADFGVILKYAKNGSEKKSLAGSDSLVQIPVSEGLTSIEFYSENVQVSFQDMRWVYAVNSLPEKISSTGKDNESLPLQKENNPALDAKKETLEKQDLLFKNILRRASNALLKLDDIEIERKTNSDLDDIIDGVTLQLTKTGEMPVKLSIAPDNETPKKQIISFVEAYNELVAFATDNSEAKKDTKVGDYKQNLAESGILVSNATVRSLLNGLRMRVSSAYPAVREPNYHTLHSIGIHTGAIGSKWEDPELKRGYLQIDENKLIEALSQYSEAVQELFSLDKNGDRRPDSGYAHETIEFLEPYTRYTGGIITAQINSNEDRIKYLNKEIKKVEDHAKAYEDKMRQRFGYMESSVSRQKSTGKYLQQRFGQKDN